MGCAHSTAAAQDQKSLRATVDRQSEKWFNTVAPSVYLAPISYSNEHKPFLAKRCSLQLDLGAIS